MISRFHKNLYENLLPFMRIYGSPVIVVLFWLLAFYPAKMTPDSIDVLNQVRTGAYNDAHTIAYVLFVYITSLGGKFIALTALVQSILVISSVKILLTSLKPTLKHSTAWKISSLIYLSPFIGGIAVTIWKDVPFAAFSILLISHVIKIKNLDVSSIKKLTLLTILASVFRHDGWPTVILSAFIVLIFSFFSRHQRKQLRQISVLLVLGALVGVLMVNSLNYFSGIPQLPKYGKYAGFIHDLQYINVTQPSLLDGKTRTILNSISQGDSAKGSSDCTNTNGLFFNEGFNADKANEFSSEIPTLWIDAARSGALLELIEVRLCRTKNFLPPVFSKGPVNGSPIVFGIIQPNTLNISDENVLPIFRMLAWGIQLKTAQFHLLLGWPGLHFLISILLVVGVFWKSRSERNIFALLLAFILGRLGILVLFSPGGDFRYSYAIYVISSTLIVVFFSTLNFISIRNLSIIKKR